MHSHAGSQTPEAECSEVRVEPKDLIEFCPIIRDSLMAEHLSEHIKEALMNTQPGTVAKDLSTQDIVRALPVLIDHIVPE